MSFLDDDRVVWGLILILLVVFIALAASVILGDTVNLEPDPASQECEERFNGEVAWASYNKNTSPERWAQGGVPMLSCSFENGTGKVVMCYDGCGSDVNW